MEPQSVESETEDRERVAELTQAYDTLRQVASFPSEEDRMRWRWRLHQLRRQHEQHEAEMPSRLAVHAASLLAAIENQIGTIPLEGELWRSSRARASSAAAAIGEFRITVNDDDNDNDDSGMKRRGSIPIMENEVMTTMSDARQNPSYRSWQNMVSLVRAASGRTLSALTRSTSRGRDSSMTLSHLSSSNDPVDYEVSASVSSSLGAEESARISESSGSSPRSVELEVEEKQVNMGDRNSSDHGAMAAYRRQESSGGGRQSVPKLLRSVVNYLGLSMEETFLCQICYDYMPMTEAVALSACGHNFCEPCLRNFLEFKIREGQVYPKCFFEPEGSKSACSKEILAEDIRANVSEKAWRKYERFKFNKENELARQCPFCDHSQICAGSDQPECVCEVCEREFCFLHSNAHSGRSCATYDRKMIAVEKLNRALISEISKPCPGCKNNVEKTGGCNQMKCVVCGTSFCWICLEVIDDGVFPEHFQWWNVRGCAGNQMADVEQQGAGQKALSIVMRVLFFVIFGPPAFLLAVLFTLLCCCFLPCTANASLTFRQAFTTCFCVSGYVLVAPVVLAVGLVGLGVVIGGAALGAGVLLVASPFLFLMMLSRPNSMRLKRDRRSSASAAAAADTSNARDLDDPNADRSPSDLTIFRVST